MMNHSMQCVLLERIRRNRSFSTGKGKKMREGKLERLEH